MFNRNYQQTKQPFRGVKKVKSIGPNDLREGDSGLFDINGQIYQVIKINGKLHYSMRYTAIKDNLTAHTIHLNGDSLYLGNVKFFEPTSTQDSYILTFDNGSKRVLYEPSTGGSVGAHASDHEVGGSDLIDHDNLTNFVADEHIDWTNATTNLVTTGSIRGSLGHFGGSTNYSNFEADGTLKFNGDATVWDDLQINISSVRLPVANAPSWTAYKGGQVLEFDPGDIIYFTGQLPHSYQEGSDIEFHLHTALPSASTSTGVANVKWKLQYTWASISSTISTGTSIETNFDVVGRSADVHTLDEIIYPITGTGKGISSILLCELSRIASTGSSYQDGVYLLAADFHFKKDTVGSREEVTK